jgi:DNA-binding NarL/FixJ family response regulator
VTADQPPNSIAPTIRSGGHRLVCIAIVSDPAARALFHKVIQRERLFVTDDLTEGLALAEGNPPDLAFVEIGMGDGAGLALVHHLKAVIPSVTIYALSSRRALEAAANAVALGGAGIIMMPLAGDDVLTAVTAVKTKLADRTLRAELERASMAYARAAGWMARVAELADNPSRTAAAERLVEVLTEATGAAGAAVYLTTAERGTELVRAASAGLDRAPPLGLEADVLEFARREHLLVVPLSIRSLRAGHVLLTRPPEGALVDAAGTISRAPPAGGPQLDGLVKLLATQATTAFALLGERERGTGTNIKDPASSAYSFAYYVDVAGREIDKARRYGRRFAIATVAFEPAAPDGADGPPISHTEMADQLLKAARDVDVLAHVDEHEFHLLMPETDGLGAHAARRRIFSRLAERGGRGIPRGLLVGVSTFPHDGQNLSQLLRVARRRAEATRHSLVRRLSPEQGGVLDLLGAFTRDAEATPPGAVSAARAIELPISDAVALATTVVSDALRGGATILVVAHHEHLSLGAAVRASLGPARDNLTFHAIDVRPSSNGENVEALAVIAEHGAYALVARNVGGVVKGIHAGDPLLADLLAERLGRAAGLRLFN